MGAESKSLSLVVVYLPRKVNIRLTFRRTVNICSSIHFEVAEEEKKIKCACVSQREMGAEHMKRDVGIEAAAEIRERESALALGDATKKPRYSECGLWPLLRALFDSRDSWLLYSLE